MLPNTLTQKWNAQAKSGGKNIKVGAVMFKYASTRPSRQFSERHQARHQPVAPTHLREIVGPWTFQNLVDALWVCQLIAVSAPPGYNVSRIPQAGISLHPGWYGAWWGLARIFLETALEIFLKYPKTEIRSEHFFLETRVFAEPWLKGCSKQATKWVLQVSMPGTHVIEILCSIRK